MPTERDRTNRPRPSSGSKPSSQKMTAVMPSMFIGMWRPVIAFSASSTAWPIAAQRPDTVPAATALATRANSGAVRGSTGWKRWPKPGTIFSPASRWRWMTAVAASTTSPSVPGLRGDFPVELHALLPRAAMDVVEHVDRRGHGAIDRQPAAHRHARRSQWTARVDRGRRLAPMPLPANPTGRVSAVRHATSARSCRENAPDRSTPRSGNRESRSCPDECR